MKDKRIWGFKRRAEEDNFITAGACRLILRIASWRYCTKHHPADSEFALSWRDIAAWYDFEGPEAIKDEHTIYRWMRELVLNHYLFYNGRKGCPPKSCYRLDLDFVPQPLTLFDWAAEQANHIVRAHTPNREKVHELNREKVHESTRVQTGKSIRGKNRAPHIGYSLREEMVQRPKGRNGGAIAPEDGKNGGEIDARSARKDDSGEGVGSLRSKENGEAQIVSASALKATGSLASEYLPESQDSSATAPDSTSLRCVPPDDASLRMSETKLENCPEILDASDVERLARAGVKLPKEVAKKFKRVLIPILREKISARAHRSNRR